MNFKRLKYKKQNFRDETRIEKFSRLKFNDKKKCNIREKENKDFIDRLEGSEQTISVRIEKELFSVDKKDMRERNKEGFSESGL